MKKSYQQNKNSDERIVITGMGVMTPLACSLNSFYEALMSGQSAIKHWQNRESLCRSKIGGDMSNFDVPSYFTNQNHYSDEHVRLAKKLLRSNPLSSQLAVLASLQAYYDAGHSLSKTTHHQRFGCVLSGHNFNINYGYKNSITHRFNHPDYIEPLFGLLFLDNDMLAAITELLQIFGPGLCIGNSFTSSHSAILVGANLIKQKRADSVIMTSTAQDLSDLSLESLASMGLISIDSYNETPEKASRPFDAKREGWVPSHGAAALVLESLSHAEQRGARIYAELIGGSINFSTLHSFYPTLQFATKAMQDALKDARINLNDIDYINAHADSSLLGDSIEVAAIKQVFDHKSYDLVINSTKSIVGHCLAASGALECVAAILQMHHGTVHPTINQEEKDPELDLNFVPNQGIDHKIKFALSNSFGSSGFASSIVLGKW